MMETKWPVGSVHPVYGKVEDSFYIKGDDLLCKVFVKEGGNKVFVTEQGLDVTAELHSLFSGKVTSDLIYDALKSLPPEALDVIEHTIYAIHQENNHKYPEI